MNFKDLTHWMKHTVPRVTTVCHCWAVKGPRTCKINHPEIIGQRWRLIGLLTYCDFVSLRLRWAILIHSRFWKILNYTKTVGYTIMVGCIFTFIYFWKRIYVEGHFRYERYVFQFLQILSDVGKTWFLKNCEFSFKTMWHRLESSFQQ